MIMDRLVSRVRDATTGAWCAARYRWLPVIAIVGLSGCASTEELFAQYESEFCPAPARLVETKKEVLSDRVEVREVAAALAPEGSGETLPWEPAVYFKSDSAQLTRVATQSLAGNLELLQQFPKFRVSIRGFTDVHSSAQYNIELSKRRISAVREYLMEGGLQKTRVIGRSHGEATPLADTDSPIADEINRRVELMLLDENGRPLPSRQSIIMGPTE